MKSKKSNKKTNIQKRYKKKLKKNNETKNTILLYNYYVSYINNRIINYRYIIFKTNLLYYCNIINSFTQFIGSDTTRFLTFSAKVVSILISFHTKR